MHRCSWVWWKLAFPSCGWVLKYCFQSSDVKWVIKTFDCQLSMSPSSIHLSTETHNCQSSRHLSNLQLILKKLKGYMDYTFLPTLSLPWAMHFLWDTGPPVAFHWELPFSQASFHIETIHVFTADLFLGSRWQEGQSTTWAFRMGCSCAGLMASCYLSLLTLRRSPASPKWNPHFWPLLQTCFSSTAQDFSAARTEDTIESQPNSHVYMACGEVSALRLEIMMHTLKR